MAVSEMPLIDAALMAIEEINQAGGILHRPIHPVIGNGASSPTGFTAQARYLMHEQRVTTLFGCWSSDTRKALLPLLEEANGLLWYPLQHEGLEASRNIFYTGSCPNQKIEPAVDWFTQHRGSQFYLLGSDDVFPRTIHKIIRSRLVQQGGRVVGDRYLPVGTLDFQDIIEEIQRSKPAVVFNTLSGESNLAFYRQFYEAGITAEKLPILSVNFSETDLNFLGAAAIGHYAVWNYFQSLETSANQAFVQRFKARHGLARVTSDPIETAYSQVYLWKEAVEAAQSFDVDEVRVAAYGESFAGPGGVLTLEPNHHAWKYCRIGCVQPDGQFKIVYNSPDPIKPLPWLGVEESEFSGAAAVIDMLAEVSQTVQKNWVIEQKSKILEETTRLLEAEITERQRAEQEVRLLLSISQVINQAPNLESALKCALQQLCQVTGWPYGELWWPNAAVTQLKCSPIWHLEENRLTPEQGGALKQFRCYTEQTTFEIDEGFLGQVWQTGRARWSRQFGLYGAVGVPILSPQAVGLMGEGETEAIASSTGKPKVLAILVFLLPELREQSKRLIKLISAVAAQLGTVVQQKKAEEALRHKNEQLAKTLRQLKATQNELVLSEKMAALGQLVAGVAHEINTPLGAICSSVEYISDFLAQDLEKLPDFFHALSDQRRQLFIELIQKLRRPEPFLSNRERRQVRRKLTKKLEDQGIAEAHGLADLLIDLGIYEQPDLFLPILQEEADGQEFLEMMQCILGLYGSSRDIALAAERASKVVFALKTYSHYDHTGTQIEVNVLDGLEAVLTLYQNKFKSGVELVRNYGDDLPMLLCYPDELTQVWTNLIHNALQAMNGKGRLLLEVRNLRHAIEVCVTDSGCGIPEEVRQHIFKPFFTTKPPGEGSGLGLDIVRKIIEKHCGTIAIDSIPGRTTFAVTLPLTAEQI